MLSRFTIECLSVQKINENIGMGMDDIIEREVFWWVLEKKGVHLICVDVFRRCMRGQSCIKIVGESTYKFLVNFSSRMDFEPCLSPV